MNNSLILFLTSLRIDSLSLISFILSSVNFSPISFIECPSNSFKKVLKVLPQGDVVIKARSRISQIRSLVPKRYAVKQVISKKIKNISHLKDNPSKSIGKKLILEKINYTVGSDSVRFEVHTNEAVTFSQGRLSKPDRVYINFNETQLADTVTKNIKIQLLRLFAPRAVPSVQILDFIS